MKLNNKFWNKISLNKSIFGNNGPPRKRLSPPQACGGLRGEEDIILPPYSQLPIPIDIFQNLDKDSILLSRELLKNKGGIYSFVNTVNGKRYIGSAKDLYLRLIEHLNNIALQEAFEKYGQDKFHFVIYEYFSYVDKTTSHKLLTDLETSYINKFDFDTLYNFKALATSMLGYKHTEEEKWLEDKDNHPMFGKTHTEEALELISKPGKLNPMYGKNHSEETKVIMSERKNKYPFLPASF